MTKNLNLRYLDFIWKVCIFCKNYPHNGEIKINLAHLNAFISQCFPDFPNYKNGYLGRLICHIFGISTVNFGISTVSFSPFQGSNRFVALLPQSDKIIFQYHNEYRMLSFFVRTLPVKFHYNYLSGSSLAVYTMNQIFLEGFYHGWSHYQEIHLPSFHEFPPDSLQMPRTTFLQRTTRNWSKISIPGTVYAILILPVTLVPLTGFHASKRRDISLRRRKFEFFAKCLVISNHPIINYCNQVWWFAFLLVFL